MRQLNRAFGEPGYLDVGRDKIIEIFLGRQKLAQLTDRRIHPAAVLGAKLGLRVPHILVATRTVDQVTVPGAKQRATANYGVEVVLEEPIGLLEIGDVSITSVLQEMMIALYSNPLLLDTQGKHRAERLHEITLVDFRGFPITESSVEVHYLYEVVYWFDRNVFTQKRFADPTA